MIFTKEERRLLALYYSGSVADTVGTLRLALRDMNDSDERAVVYNILRKIEGAGDSKADGFAESGAAYD